MNLFKNKVKIAVFVLVFLGLLLRIILSTFGNHPDLMANASWGKWIYDHGSKNFYENNIRSYVYPDEPPLLVLTLVGLRYLYEFSLRGVHFTDKFLIPHFISGFFPWWQDWLNWFDENSFYPQTFIPNGYLVFLKLPGILAETTLAIFILLRLDKLKSDRFKLAVLLLFLPFGWYLNSLWGQFDALAGLLLVLSIWLVHKKWFVFSAALFTILVSLKPQMLVYIPIYLTYFIYQKPGWKKTLAGLVAGVVLAILPIIPFSTRNPIDYFIGDIMPRVFSSYRFRITDHAFNLWSVFYPAGTANAFKVSFIFSNYLWGIILCLIFYALSLINIIRARSFESIIYGFYIVSMSTFLFLTGMHERYFYPTVILLAWLALYSHRFFKWWIVATVLFSVNLFYSWGYPWLNESQIWSNTVLIQLFSLIQIVVLVGCLYEGGLSYKMDKGGQNGSK